MTFWQLFDLTISLVIVLVLLFFLFISGSKYSVADAESHATDYAGVIKEGHGGVTIFLWVLFIGLFIWTIVYFVLHWSEFGIIAAYAE